MSGGVPVPPSVGDLLRTLAEVISRPATSQWLSVAEAAAEIQAGTKALRMAIARGELRAGNAGTDARPRLRIHRDDLIAWVLRSDCSGGGAHEHHEFA